ncbi:E3 ubiquitin-protein ligase RSL1-like [Cornus florida]|uniref:E3 ubiquitin-protein ligase RSL1-like n=1 Tax=Cornus florida TaxID=4283 RepID=UPI0028A12177|nr:E3 ubiquitin-protein ligase RSL1-like [Cornus florida]
METDELQSMLSEQRREIMAVKAIDSDLDIAFKLQMQEAMNASLSLQPSSSSSSSLSSQPPQVHLPEDDDDDVTGSVLAHFLAEEIDRFEQERSDREQVEAEMRRMRDDIDRQMHDQIFARDLLGVPEEEWINTGDHFHRPYGEGTSAAGEANAETFRLYFKGLVSEETVGGEKKVLASIGVAICGLRNDPIFEFRKPLGGCETSGESAEVEALIEGLNAAVTLGLKRVTIYCDDNTLFQYLTGQGRPRQCNIAALVEQVTLLRRKFTCCNSSLVAQNDIKFAFELARDAIVSQITRPAENSHGKNLIEICVICTEDTDVTQMFWIDYCLHRYCFSCMKQHVEVKLHQGMLPKCPHEGCKSLLKIESCRKFLTSELYDIMSQHIKEASIPATDKVYCPNPRCSALMSKIEMIGSAINVFAGAQVGARKCAKCGGFFCVNCKVAWHNNMTCYDYKRLNPYPCEEDAKLKSVARRNAWRQCVKCNHMVELAEGCYHIYCRCGYEFCYTCGAEWKNKKATCNCPIWDERNIIHN